MSAKLPGPRRLLLLYWYALKLYSIVTNMFDTCILTHRFLIDMGGLDPWSRLIFPSTPLEIIFCPAIQCSRQETRDNIAVRGSWSTRSTFARTTEPASP